MQEGVSRGKTTKGEQQVMANLRRKAQAADRMFTSLVEQMNNVLKIEKGKTHDILEEVPPWLSSIKN